MEPITITDKEILTFYAENPHINFIAINHIFTDFLKQLTLNASTNIQLEFIDFLNKNTINKNTMNKNIYQMLQIIVPQDEVLNINSETYLVNRKNKIKPTILFENKDYNYNVSSDEVKQFERNIKMQQTHGICISQTTSIDNKENLHIDIIDGLIHLYISNANYQVDKLKTAIDIVDNLSAKLESIQNINKNRFTLEQSDIDELANECRTFENNKAKMLETIENMNKTMLDNLEKIQFPKLQKIFRMKPI
jgi:ACT domain-containing protein